MNESSLILLLGLLADNQTSTAGSVLYDRSEQKISARTIDGTPVAADVILQLTVAGVLAGDPFTIPADSNRADVDLSETPITCLATQDLGVKVIDANEARNLIVTVSGVGTGAALDPNWQIPTVGDLQALIADDEWEQFTAGVIHSGGDPSPRLLTWRVGQVRSLASRRSKLGAAGTVPTSFFTDLLVLTKDDLYSGVSALRRFRESFKDKVEDADIHLKMLAKGEWPVEPPAAPLPADEQPVPGATWGSDEPVDL